MTGVGTESAALFERLTAGTTIALSRGTSAICIPVFRQHELFVACFESVAANTPTTSPILVADDASPDGVTERHIERLAARGALRHRVLYLRQRQNVGFVRNVNSAFAVLDSADVVVVNSDVVVGPEWLERLRGAAYADTNIATATALTNHGTILSVPNRNDPQPELPGKATIEEVARAVAARSPQLRPRIPTAIGHCTYIRRDALDLVGFFDETFSPGYGEEVDFSQRCIARGLTHVAADDVLVFHRGSGSFGDTSFRDQHEQLLEERYPYYGRAVRDAAQERTGPLARSLASARTAVKPLSVTLDVRFLGRTITGTQVQALELVHALWRTKQVDLRVLGPSRLGEWEREFVRSLDGVEYVADTALASNPSKYAKTDIVHRLSQVFNWPDLSVTPDVSDRFVITHLDFIAYRNPTYAQTYEEWHEYRRLTRLALALADVVVFMSAHPARDALAEDLVEPDRVRVVHLGVDHNLSRGSRPMRPDRLFAAADLDFILCIGTNFRHKNRIFALRLLEALQRRHGWDGWLVLAGPHADAGTSADDEHAFLAANPRVAARVADVKTVSEGEKAWLYEAARGVVFPSTYEGFGLVPFEAAAHGTPCFHAHQTSLQDLLPVESATLVAWDADASADVLVDLLKNGDRARELVDGVVAAGRELTWTRAACELLQVYADVVGMPNRDVARLADAGIPVPLRALTSGHTELLSPQARRAVYTFAANPRTRGVFLGAMRLLYTAAYLTRFGRRPPPPVEEQR